MPTVKFSTGQSVYFAKTPTAQDIQDVATKLGIDKAQGTPTNVNVPVSHQGAVDFIKSGVAPGYKGPAPSTNTLKNFTTDFKSNLGGESLTNPIQQVKDIGGAVSGGFNQLSQGFGTAANAQNPAQLFHGVGQIGSGLAGIAASPAAPIFKPVSNAVNAVSGAISNVPQVQQFANSKAGQITSDVAENVGNYANTAGLAAGLNEATPTIDRGLTKIETGASRILHSLTPETEDALTRAIKPGKNNTSFPTDLKNSLPYLQETSQIIGKPITDLESLDNTITATKQRVWKNYESLLGPNAQLTIDGNQIADSMISSVDKRWALQNPQQALKLVETANKYRGPIPLGVAEEFLQSGNNELSTYYAKNKVGQSVAARDPQVSPVIAETNGLRQALYQRLGEITGKDAAQLKQTYGGLTNLQNEVIGRKNVFNRQNPLNLVQQYSRISGLGDIIKGINLAKPGESALNVGTGVGKVLLGEHMKSLNDPNYLIESAFKKLIKKGEAKTNINNFTGSSPKQLSAPQDRTVRNNVPIRLGAKSQSTLDAQELAKMKRSRIIRPTGKSQSRSITQIFGQQ